MIEATTAADVGLRGILFNIQRFSTSDGPGVRTTVFLKGCTNDCAWCHNPESLQSAPRLRVFLDRCIGCGRCILVCPQSAQRLEGEDRTYQREACTACGACAGECFSGALEITGRAMDVNEVMAEIVKDEPYYRHSGGGVTFSGGEPVLQTDFLRHLLVSCQRQGLHTAVDTAGHYPWSLLESLLPHVDLVMYDLKVLDPQTHRRFVGNDGSRIRENLERLGATACPLIVRTPVVGGVNDTEEEIDSIARFIGALDNLQYYELLPYHALGDDKLGSLGFERDGRFQTPAREKLQALADVARRHVSEVRPHATPSATRETQTT